MKERKVYKVLTREEEVNLIENYMFLAEKASKKYSWADTDSNMIFSFAMEGLLIAARTYDSDRSESYEAYANLCIKTKILNRHKSGKKYKDKVSVAEEIIVSTSSSMYDGIDDAKMLEDFKKTLSEEELLVLYYYTNTLSTEGDRSFGLKELGESLNLTAAGAKRRCFNLKKKFIEYVNLLY